MTETMLRAGQGWDAIHCLRENAYRKSRCWHTVNQLSAVDQ